MIDPSGIKNKDKPADGLNQSGVKKVVNRAEELEKLKTNIVDNMKKMCSYCNIIPYQNQLGIAYTSKK